VGTYAPPQKSPLSSKQNTDDEEQVQTPSVSESYRESTPSDSGTEADDEHFLKGLPAPKLKPHKGLRGDDGTFSGSPSPLPSPAILEIDTPKSLGYLRGSGVKIPALREAAARRKADNREKLKVEIIRRVSETALLGFVGGIICLNPEVRQLVRLWRRGMCRFLQNRLMLTVIELACQSLVITSLVSVYPLRLLRNMNPSRPWKRPFRIAIPSSFDPAPLLYPPIITMLVSLLLSTNNAIGLLPSIILSICSLPKQLIPSAGGIDSLYICHWFLSCLPILIPKHNGVVQLLESPGLEMSNLDSEILVLLQPLHSAVCDTLQYLTTTSLLPAELQLLSISLIELLLLAASPQAVILKSILWGCGIGILISCTHVLGWGVALARVPKWRFRRSGSSTRKRTASKIFGDLGGFGVSIFTRPKKQKPVFDDSSDDDIPELWTIRTSGLPKLGLKTRETIPPSKPQAENGSISAIDTHEEHDFANGPAKNKSDDVFGGVQRRHTLPTIAHVPEKSSKRTPSGRRKRSASSSVQSFFTLTQAQASLRKWLYAGWVYACIIVIILAGVREYVAKFALGGSEPIGWALGYLFGDIPWFRMEILKANLQRWVLLPTRTGLENKESCHLGWVEHLRHSSFGEANTRLILCAYWLAIIIVGLAIVLRLSAIYEVDTRRKVFHFMMVAMLLPATYVDPTFPALALGLMLAIFLLLDLFRASQLPPLSKSLAYFLTPYVDGRDLKGPVVISHIFLLIGCAIPLWLSLGTLPRVGKGPLAGWEVPTREVGMVSGVICVGLGDAAASLIGRRYGRNKWIWGGGKSIEGSVAFATAVGIALVLAKAWLRIGDWTANNDDDWVMTLGKSGIAAGVASLTEAVLTGGNDNVVVPVVLWLCVKGLDI
jgi:dolichol kinase